MYLHPRLLALTEGVRLRILAAAVIGLLAVAVGVARLAVAATVIVKVIHEGAAFSTLTWALVIMAGLIVARSLLQYLQVQNGKGTTPQGPDFFISDVSPDEGFFSSDLLVTPDGDVLVLVRW